MRGYTFHYLKTKRGAKTPDFMVEFENDRAVIEIGEKGKGRTPFKGVEVDTKLILSHDPRAGTDQKPLSLIGFIV